MAAPSRLGGAAGIVHTACPRSDLVSIGLQMGSQQIDALAVQAVEADHDPGSRHE